MNRFASSPCTYAANIYQSFDEGRVQILRGFHAIRRCDTTGRTFCKEHNCLVGVTVGGSFIVRHGLAVFEIGYEKGQRVFVGCRFRGLYSPKLAEGIDK